ncbi:hypothetical protein KCU85_g9963, partial [Aureobasidium melanogenum]
MTRRFLRRGTRSPFEWMFDLRSYGQHLAMQSTSGGRVGWTGDRLSYGDISLDMSQLRRMVSLLSYDTRHILDSSLLLGLPTPAISIQSLADNPENVEFRVKQEEVLRAVYDGVSPILAVMPTGSGKSMSFILPASYEFSGTTIVVVPLLALQEDMLSRPGQLSIPARIWGRSSVDTAAKIIFVTPESARTADFLAHFHRLRTAGEIDRIVFDECHVFSDDDVTFRPAIKELVGLFQFGVRLVFLTATLPVSQELPFWRLLGLHRVPVRTIRADTTRHNLAYTVSYVQLDDRIAEIERHVNSLEHGKMIIYCRRKYTVTTLAEHLGCPYYYYYSSYEHKQASIEQFLATDKGIIITTNALGLGIDIPDVRVVIHYDCPDNLISYAQESGRAGRDGDPGRCILMVDKASLRTTAYEENNARQPQKRPHAAMDWRFTDLWLQQYIGSPDLARCRRTTLSEYLDGIQRADGCANLTRCDVCAAPATLPRTATGAPSPVPIRDHSIAFRAQQSGLELVRQHVQATQVADAVQKEQVVRFLSSMGTTCFQCLAFGRDAAHAPSDCIEPRDASIMSSSNALVRRSYDPTRVATAGPSQNKLVEVVRQATTDDAPNADDTSSLVVVRLTAKGNQALYELCHTADQKEVWRFPSYEFVIHKGSITASQVKTGRPSYVNAVLIASRGLH